MAQINVVSKKSLKGLRETILGNSPIPSPDHFDVDYTLRQGVRMRLRRSLLSGSIRPRFPVTLTSDTTAEIGEGTLFAPKITGTDAANEFDMERTQAIIDPFFIHPITFPLEVDPVAIGDCIHLDLTWGLLIEELKQDPADIPTLPGGGARTISELVEVSGWHLTAISASASVAALRADFTPDYAAGTATSTFPLALVQDDGEGNPVISPVWEDDIHLAIDMHYDRSRTEASAGTPGGGPSSQNLILVNAPGAWNSKVLVAECKEESSGLKQFRRKFWWQDRTIQDLQGVGMPTYTGSRIMIEGRRGAELVDALADCGENDPFIV